MSYNVAQRREPRRTLRLSGTAVEKKVRKGKISRSVWQKQQIRSIGESVPAAASQLSLDRGSQVRETPEDERVVARNDMPLREENNPQAGLMPWAGCGWV